MAPEVVMSASTPRVYDEKVDVWSLGITAIEAVEMDPPLAHFDPMKALLTIPTAPAPILRHAEKFSLPFVDFVHSCLVKVLVSSLLSNLRSAKHFSL